MPRGKRKLSGSYFTPEVLVDHFIDSALDPQIEKHLDRIASLLRRGKVNRAAERFYEFSVADLTMGSGHFLTAATDWIALRFADFLETHSLQPVEDELSRLVVLSGGRADTFDILRRQVARRCIYGIDADPFVVDLARFVLSAHVFTPGLPMIDLHWNLAEGNSLAGVATVNQAISYLDGANEAVRESHRKTLVGSLRRAANLRTRAAGLGDANSAESQEIASLYVTATTRVKRAAFLCDLSSAVKLGLLQPAWDSLPSTRVLASATAAKQYLHALSTVHLPVLFPEVFTRSRPGFNVLLGNPPWDGMREDPGQFWTIRHPGMRNLSAAQRKAEIERLRVDHPAEADEEAALIAANGRLRQVCNHCFSLAVGTGNLAQMFVERNLDALRGDGSLGLVLPQGTLGQRSWRHVRRALLEGSRVTAVETRNTRRWLFAGVTDRVPITFLTRHKAQGAPSVTIIPGVRDAASLRAASGGIRLLLSELRRMDEDLSVPWFSSSDDSEVFDTMRTHPRLGDDAGWIVGHGESRWAFSNGAPHASFASPTRTPGAWAITMARHVDQFALTRDPVRLWVTDPTALASSRGRDGIEIVDGVPRLSSSHPTIIYRTPSANDNNRTLVATALPESGWISANGYSGGIAHPEGTETEDILALLGYINTLTADWWARRFVERHVVPMIMNALPLPTWSKADRVEAARLTRALLRRSGLRTLPGGVEIARTWAQPDEEIRVRLDILALRGFGLSAQQAEVILRDFNLTSGYLDALHAALPEMSDRFVARESRNIRTRPRSRGATRRSGPNASVVRAWAKDNGFDLGARGRLPNDAMAAYLAAPKPSDIRRWAKGSGVNIGDRGRIPDSISRAYADAHRDADRLDLTLVDGDGADERLTAPGITPEPAAAVSL
jgi:hypothetical protein